MNERRLKLAEALLEEVKTLPEYNGFGEKNDLSSHSLAVSYLRSGQLPNNWEDIDLLYGLVEDFEDMCLIYNID